MSIPVTHVYAEDSAALKAEDTGALSDGVYAGEVCVEDLADHNAACEQFEVTVINAAPKDVDPGFDRSVDEGESISLSSSRYTDPGTLDTHAAVVDWGDGVKSDATVTEHPFGPPGRPAGLVGGISQAHVYLDDGAYPVTVCVTDDEGAEACGDGTTVTVNNVAPDIRLVSTQKLRGSSPPRVTSGETFTLFFSITDQGPLDTHTITVSWGDGSTSAQPTSDRSFVPVSHKYKSRTSTKNFDLTVTVMDDDGGSGSLTMTIRALAAPGGAPPPTFIIVPFQPVRGDFNGDGLLTEADIVLFQGAFGSVEGDSTYLNTADLNTDGFIDLRDLGILASLFGAQG